MSVANNRRKTAPTGTQGAITHSHHRGHRPFDAHVRPWVSANAHPAAPIGRVFLDHKLRFRIAFGTPPGRGAAIAHAAPPGRLFFGRSDAIKSITFWRITLAGPTQLA